MLFFFILEQFSLFYYALKDKSTKTFQNKSIMTNEYYLKTKILLNQKQLIFLAKSIGVALLL